MSAEIESAADTASAPEEYRVGTTVSKASRDLSKTSGVAMIVLWVLRRFAGDADPVIVDTVASVLIGAISAWILSVRNVLRVKYGIDSLTEAGLDLIARRLR